MAELMKVKQLRPRMGNVFIELEIVSIGETREFASAKGQGKVCSAEGKDETGEVQLSLWNEQIDQVKEGQKVRIENGWVSEYKGQLQLSTGKFGTMHVL
jgi:replication factor A1